MRLFPCWWRGAVSTQRKAVWSIKRLDLPLTRIYSSKWINFCSKSIKWGQDHEITCVFLIFYREENAGILEAWKVSLHLLWYFFFPSILEQPEKAWCHALVNSNGICFGCCWHNRVSLEYALYVWCVTPLRLSCRLFLAIFCTV